jgi:cytochrome c553
VSEPARLLVRSLLALAVLGLIAACASTARNPEPPSRLERLAAGCNGCHGPGGRGSGAIPTLRARTPAWIAEQLETWRTDAEADGRDHVMVRFARALTPEDVAALADHYGTPEADR